MQTAHPSPTEPAHAGLTRHPHFAAGRKLAGCFILQSETVGGAGTTIWLADDEVLGKSVSLHLLPDAVRHDEQAMDELRHQIRRNRQLIHPNILRVYDLVEESEWAAISTDVVEGESLAALRRKSKGGHLEMSEIKPWLVQLCQTLDDAHRIQLCHADLSPEHLYLGKDGKLVVANFGIGRTLRDALWRCGALDGGVPPVENLSPQMLDGHAATPADDVYAMGVLIHELLVGAAPFSGPELAESIRRATPSRMLERRKALGRAGGPIAAHWESVAAACLEKTPERRPKNLADVANRLGFSNVELTPDTAPVEEAQVPPPAPEAKAPAVEERKTSLPEPKPLPSNQAEDAAKPALAAMPSFKAASPFGPKPARSPFVPKPAPIEPSKSDLETAAEKPAESSIPDDFPRLRKRSGFPITGLAAAAMLMALCVYAVFNGEFQKRADTESEDARFADPTAQEPQYARIPSPEPPTPADPVTPDEDANPTVETPAEPLIEVATAEPAPPAPPIVITKPEKLESKAEKLDSKPDLILAAAPPKKATPAPKTGTRTPGVATPIPAGHDATIAQKTAALEAARKAAGDADAARQDMLKRKEQADAAAANLKKTLDEKSAAAAPMLKAMEEIAALKQKREEDARTAALAADAAKKAAEEKARQADEARKALDALEKESKDKLAAQRKAESELEDLKKAIADKERIASESAKLADAAMVRKEEQLEAMKQNEQDLAAAKAAAEEAERMELARRREQEERRSRIMKDIDDAKRLFEEQMKKLNSLLQDTSSAPPTTPEKPSTAPAPDRLPPLPTKPETPAATPKPSATATPPAPATPAPAPASAPTPVVAATPSAATPAQPSPEPPTVTTTPAAAAPTVSTTPTPPPPAPPAPSAPAVVSKTPPATPAPAMLAKADVPTSPLPSVDTRADATTPLKNSLGMKFVPVGDVLFGIWPTRVKDFDTFATATNLKSSLWRDPGFKQDPDHPVVNVTWQQATAFCKWLTLKEQREGSLPPGKTYRLPTDVEWSKAVGLSEESGRTPEARDMGVADIYPWGQQWPPPPGSGNYTGEETGSDVAIKGYNDKFAWTAPVGSFPPNKYGLYDMGGNVWQWVMDSWNNESNSKVLRGASWYNGALKLSLLSSCRVHAAPDSSTDNYGFRVVISSSDTRSVKR